jgi:hypothetical protein
VINKGEKMRKHKWDDPRYVGGIDTGDRIYYKGDMANVSGWGTVTKVEPCDWYHKTITIKLEDGRVQKINPYMLGCQTEADKPIYNQGGLERHVIAYKKEWEVA